ncbi:GntR family transcriptional regulator [Georgenia sp. Z1491]|uniref:GntR family transcriptional regulator n=1 Tax=Georgenia sp. Z1491 TaxID=3416707 RepID=UPI003CEF23A6
MPLADKVHDILLVQFMNGMRPPGQRLNIEKLSRELDLSPTPVREALARLEHTGFVRREALRGYEVAPLLTPKEIVQLMDARLLIEPTLAAEATPRSTPEFLAELDETIAVMERVGAVADGEALRQCWLADEAFHALISKQAGNPFTERAYQALGGQLQRFRLIGEAGVSHAHRAAREHRRLFEALSAADAEQAANRMREHIESAKNRTLDDERAAQDAKQAARD